MCNFGSSSLAKDNHIYKYTHTSLQRSAASNLVQHHSSTAQTMQPAHSHRAALLALVPESSQFYSEGSHLLRLGLLFVRGAQTLAALLITRACHTQTQNSTLNTHRRQIIITASCLPIKKNIYFISLFHKRIKDWKNVILMLYCKGYIIHFQKTWTSTLKYLFQQRNFCICHFPLYIYK